MARFNEEKLRVECLTDAVSLLAFMFGMKDEQLVLYFGKKTLSTFSKALSRAQKYISAGELIHSKRDPDGKHTDHNTKRERSREKQHRSRWEKANSKQDRLVQWDPQRKFENARDNGSIWTGSNGNKRLGAA